MERLTTWRKDDKAAIANNNGSDPMEQMYKLTRIIDRLAAIEDILGDNYDLDHLQEAVTRQEEYEQFMERWQEAVKIAGAVKDIGAERIAELIQADREGRCVVLPCIDGYDPIEVEIVEEIVVEIETDGGIYSANEINPEDFKVPEALFGG